jgi:hypothetical protein
VVFSSGVLGGDARSLSDHASLWFGGQDVFVHGRAFFLDSRVYYLKELGLLFMCISCKMTTLVAQ